MPRSSCALARAILAVPQLASLPPCDCGSCATQTRRAVEAPYRRRGPTGRLWPGRRWAQAGGGKVRKGDGSLQEARSFRTLLTPRLRWAALQLVALGGCGREGRPKLPIPRCPPRRSSNPLLTRRSEYTARGASNSSSSSGGSSSNRRLAATRDTLPPLPL